MMGVVAHHYLGDPTWPGSLVTIKSHSGSPVVQPLLFQQGVRMVLALPSSQVSAICEFFFHLQASLLPLSCFFFLLDHVRFLEVLEDAMNPKGSHLKAIDRLCELRMCDEILYLTFSLPLQIICTGTAGKGACDACGCFTNNFVPTC